MRYAYHATFAVALCLLGACAKDPADQITGWPLAPVPPGATPVAAKAMLPGIYPVGSHVADPKAPGGFGPCNNFPFPLEGHDWGAPGSVALVAFPEEPVAYGKDRGIALRLINRSSSPAAFRACDSCLHLVQEALDPAGQWKPIESLPITHCGNSYHSVTLKPRQYWQVPARTDRGPRATKLRFRLDVEGRPDGPVIYSNVFEGAIDPVQFAPP